MRHALGRAGRAELAHLATMRPLLAFDFDGTLAPIVNEPDRAALPPTTATLLRTLAGAFPCAVVSGRALEDLGRRLADIPLAFLVGNHGAEWRWSQQEPPGMRDRVQRWRDLLVASLAGLPGVVIEDKGLSLAVHYRRAPDRDRAHSAIRQAVDGLAGARSVAGRAVVNVVAPEAPHKGDALGMLARLLGVSAALFVGDDTTDEDAFAATAVQTVLAVRVGRARWSRAAWYVREQAEVDGLLEFLCTLTPPRSPPPGAQGERP